MWRSQASQRSSTSSAVASHQSVSSSGAHCVVVEAVDERGGAVGGARGRGDRARALVRVGEAGPGRRLQQRVVRELQRGLGVAADPGEVGGQQMVAGELELEQHRRARAPLGQLGQRALQQRARLAVAAERVLQARDVRDRAGAQLVRVGRERGDDLGEHVAGLGQPPGAAQRRGLARRAGPRGARRRRAADSSAAVYQCAAVAGERAAVASAAWVSVASACSSPRCAERSTWSASTLGGAPCARSAAAARAWAASRQPAPAAS